MELKESIKLLEEKIEKGKELDTRNNPMSDIIDEIIIENKAIERVLHYIKEESIPRAVVEEKIGDLDYYLNTDFKSEVAKNKKWTYDEMLQQKIDILQEILKESK